MPSAAQDNYCLQQRKPGCASGAARVLSLVLLLPILALAQDENAIRDVKIPNPMGIHTWFIIAVVGVFLAWCISYCLQLQKESEARKPRRTELLRQKDQTLNRLAELESQKESGAIAVQVYEREFRKARSRLSDILVLLKEDTAGKA
jgi:hypothetical protein